LLLSSSSSIFRDQRQASATPAYRLQVGKPHTGIHRQALGHYLATSSILLIIKAIPETRPLPLPGNSLGKFQVKEKDQKRIASEKT